MEIASRFLGMSSYKKERPFPVLPPRPALTTSGATQIRPHRFPDRSRPGRPGVSLYDKTFRFASSPIKRGATINKSGANKRRSLEISRCTGLEQREQYRRLIAQYRTSALRETSTLFSRSPRLVTAASKVGTRELQRTVIDLTETSSKKTTVLQEKFGLTNPVVNKKPTIEDIKIDSKKFPHLSSVATPSEKKEAFLQPIVSPYLSENFIPNLLKAYGRRERQRQAQACQEETRARLLREKREEKEALLAESLSKKLKIQGKQEEKPKLPEITQEMGEIINQALVPYPPQQSLVEAFNINVTREHMSTLFGLNWLNDEIINFYMELIIQRSKDCENLPSVHAMNTFFYPRLLTQGYASVRRWTKKVDIFSKDLVLYPIHLGVHWCLAVVDFTKKEIRYYDSMGGANRECLDTLRQYLLSEHKNKKSTDYNITDWQMLSLADIPQQMNGSDCGVFTCKFAEYITAKQSLTFDQSNMPYFRRAMVWEILKKKLIR